MLYTEVFRTMACKVSEYYHSDFNKQVLPRLRLAQKFDLGDAPTTQPTYTGKEIVTEKGAELPYMDVWIEFSVDDLTSVPEQKVEKLGALISRAHVRNWSKGELARVDTDAWAVTTFVQVKSTIAGTTWVIPLPVVQTVAFQEGKPPRMNCKALDVGVPAAEICDVELMADTLRESLSAVILFWKLVHCKNVEIVDAPKPNTRKRTRLRKQRKPFVEHKILQIKTSKKKYTNRPPDNGGETINPYRVHLCRGHFKTYTPDKPLMGKHTGTYWWQPMVRGNKQAGLITKDYEVRP